MDALRKVLVVDDDAVVGKSFNRVLTKDKGYVVITAQSGAEALEKMRTQNYDLVFTDIKMPGMDGVELAEQVKARQPWTPVVIITGYGTQTNEARAKAAGVADFMRKPLSPEMIEESAAHALLESAVAVEAPRVETVAPALPVEAVAPGSNLKNMALFLAAPFIGLAYALALPFVGIGMLIWTAVRAPGTLPAAKKAGGYLLNMAKFVSAPFLGLAYAVLLPLVGLALLVWVAAKALMATKQAA
ncbi:response regulator transcription factor [Rhodoferax sp.]|uniref:response regulator transcription factor n=1 Tax=Rhodoferax sp. TaxID=50421 RepID=UPI00374DE567